MTSIAKQPAWELNTDPNLTYPVVTRSGIREMTRSQIHSQIKRISTPEERISDLEAIVARQQAVIDNLAQAMSWYFNSCSNKNA